ncbi:hypothetical protein QTO34_006936 [Cnephaeus nilssonii]|uniref:Uncharacterized protein n=1 Tax=Cnephaeus nilssonii TaxID=3371016 RepID=A0AA40LHY4_CNENI|nr:hypothetical protein QTO34_006936 [Eptesicus nilssonii]
MQVVWAELGEERTPQRRIWGQLTAHISVLADSTLYSRDFHITSTSSTSASTTSSSFASFEHRGSHTAAAPGCEWHEPRGLTQFHPEFPKRNSEESRNL